MNPTRKNKPATRSRLSQPTETPTKNTPEPNGSPITIMAINQYSTPATLRKLRMRQGG